VKYASAFISNIRITIKILWKIQCENKLLLYI
jgi:hypothetical protein